MPASSASNSGLSISIVVFNSPLALLEKTLRSVGAAIAPLVDAGIERIDITLIDNGSDPDYARQLVDLVPALARDCGIDVKIRRLPDNAGFGAGHNVVIRDHIGEFHLILNPDVELAGDALLRGVQRLKRDSKLVLVSPFAQGGDGNQEFLCKRQPSVLVLCLRAFCPELGRRLFAGLMTRYEMSDVCGAQEEVEVELASGCFMLTRGAALHAAGGFDDRYFLYFEDFDLSIRLAGEGKLMYVPTVRIVHHGGYAARKGWRHLGLFVRSGLRFFQQHGWRWI